MKFVRIFSDSVENAEKRCNFSKFLDSNLIFIMIIPEIYLIFNLIFNSIFDLIFNLLFTEPSPPSTAALRRDPGGIQRDLLESLPLPELQLLFPEGAIFEL